MIRRTGVRDDCSRRGHGMVAKRDGKGDNFRKPLNQGPGIRDDVRPQTEEARCP